MRYALSVLSLGLVLLPGAAHAGDGAWAPAKAGKIECMDPDFEKKTCSAMTTYTWLDDSKVIGHTRQRDDRVLPDVLMAYDWNSVIDGDKNCTTFNSKTVEGMTFEVAGSTVSAEQAASYRSHLNDIMAPLFDREACADISPAGQAYMVQVSFDGVPNPSATSYLVWVDPDSGFSLAP